MSSIDRLTADIRNAVESPRNPGEKTKIMRDNTAMVASIHGYLIRIDVMPMGVGPEPAEDADTFGPKLHGVLIDTIKRFDEGYRPGESVQDFNSRMRG